MVLKVTSDINQGNENLQNSELQNKDEAAKLWEQYQKKKSKQKLGTCILYSFVVVIIVILIIVGLYIVFSTSDPFNSL